MFYSDPGNTTWSLEINLIAIQHPKRYTAQYWKSLVLIYLNSKHIFIIDYILIYLSNQINRQLKSPVVVCCMSRVTSVITIGSNLTLNIVIFAQNILTFADNWNILYILQKLFISLHSQTIGIYVAKIISFVGSLHLALWA